MVEEEVGVCECGIASLFWGSSRRLAIIENDNFIDAKYRTCSSDLSCQACLLVMGKSAVCWRRKSAFGPESGLGVYLQPAHKQSESLGGYKTYLAMMLPGSAMLTVWLRPPVGLKTAEGLDVSGAESSCCVFLFCDGALAGVILQDIEKPHL